MSPHPGRTVEDVSAPLEYYLIQVPPAGDTVCSVCHGPVYDGYRVCYQCNDALSVFGALRLDAVTFVSLAPRGEQMATDLITYKHANVPSHLQEQRKMGLAATLWRWLEIHEQCLLNAARSLGFDLVTTVPSTTGRTNEHPLSDVVGKIVVGTDERVQQTLAVNRDNLGPREFSRDRFVAMHEVNGQDVLVIDDTWTTGAKLQAASAALKQAGARRVGGVAIGRWFSRPDYRNNAAWLAEVKRVPWSWSTCCLNECISR